MTDASEQRRLFREAADLAIRLQNDPGNPVSVETARAWIARSPAHGSIWARVAAIHGMTGKILSEQRDGPGNDVAGPSRRSVVGGGLLALVAVGVGSMALKRGSRTDADYATATGEIRRISLPDGSILTLGPESAIALKYTESRRSVELIAGMAYAEVSPDPARPFSIRSDTFFATAMGTAFDISADAGFIGVSVDHGLVEVASADGDAVPAARLRAGEWMTLDTASRQVARGSRDASQIAVWRSGVIVAEKETVAALVARIARWQLGRVIIADPFLGSRVVSGVFDVSQPARALEAVVRPFGGKVRQVASAMTVISAF